MTSLNAWAAPGAWTRSGLERAYRTQVDPRLNYEQALEMAMAIVRKLRAPMSVGSVGR
jgi:3-deoxy-D-arabino-heptulosonate 7-phosphate (DAHP) synthase class II